MPHPLCSRPASRAPIPCSRSPPTAVPSCEATQARAQKRLIPGQGRGPDGWPRSSHPFHGTKGLTLQQSQGLGSSPSACVVNISPGLGAGDHRATVGEFRGGSKTHLFMEPLLVPFLVPPKDLHANLAPEMGRG